MCLIETSARMARLTVSNIFCDTDFVISSSSRNRLCIGCESVPLPGCALFIFFGFIRKNHNFQSVLNNNLIYWNR